MGKCSQCGHDPKPAGEVPVQALLRIRADLAKLRAKTELTPQELGTMEYLEAHERYFAKWGPPREIEPID